MTYKLWQKKLKLGCKDLCDIVQFGSSVLHDSQPNDIDIAVIFNNLSVKEQLIEAQKIKLELKGKLPIHVKPYSLKSLFEESNFARNDILFHGKSLISGINFASRFGLNPRLQIRYDLADLKKKDKVRFHYMLKGKNNQSGLLNKHGGMIINPGLIEVFPEFEKIFTKNISKITKKYELKRVFIQE